MPSIKMIRRFADPGERILEAGCGSGRTAMLLADMGYRTVALDLSRSLLNTLSPARRLWPDLHLVEGDIGSLPFGTKQFKVVYSFGVLEHFDPPDIVRYLSEQRRVARYVLIDVPNFKCDRQAFGDERFYTDEKWVSMIRAAGLRELRVVQRGLDNGRFVGNCSVFLAADEADPETLEEKMDVYDHY
jgi:SAM-dependent methyltransferase